MACRPLPIIDLQSPARREIGFNMRPKVRNVKFMAIFMKYLSYRMQVVHGSPA